MLKRLLLAGFSWVVALSVQAEEIFGEELPLNWTPVISISGGPAWTTPGQNVYLYPQVPVPTVDLYAHNSPTSTVATGEVLFGLRRIVFPGATAEAGLALGAATDAKITGNISVNGIPNYGTYSYKVNQARVQLKGKLLANRYWLQPYISGSIGPGWNNSHDFSATSINQNVFAAPWFATNTEIAFTYTAGLGVQAVLSRNWQVGMGYEFADWGKTGLGVDEATAIKGPSTMHLYTNELLFSLSYIIQ